MIPESNWEGIAYGAVMIVVLAGVFGIAYLQEQRTRAAFRAFAKRHRLEFQDERPLKRVSAYGDP